MRVAVSGAAGSMGRLVAEALARRPDIDLVALYDPGEPGVELGGLSTTEDPSAVDGADVVVEFTRPDVVMDNLRRWRRYGSHAVVGTSGFTRERIQEAAELWGSSPPNLLIVPNFSIGAVLMMRFAGEAARHFPAAEIIELHHDRKADAPSGTAAATATRIAAEQPNQRRAAATSELVPGALGAEVEGIRIHSIRLPGLVAHQEVLFGGQGELLTIRHDTTSREAFLPGVMLALDRIAELPGITVGLEALLGS